MVRYEKDTLIIEVSHCDPEHVHFQLMGSLMQITSYLCDKPISDTYILYCLSTLAHYIGEPLSQPDEAIKDQLKPLSQ